MAPCKFHLQATNNNGGGYLSCPASPSLAGEALLLLSEVEARFCDVRMPVSAQTNITEHSKADAPLFCAGAVSQAARSQPALTLRSVLHCASAARQLASSCGCKLRSSSCTASSAAARRCMDCVLSPSSPALHAYFRLHSLGQCCSSCTRPSGVTRCNSSTQTGCR
jgi:hypothetical protein